MRALRIRCWQRPRAHARDEQSGANCTLPWPAQSRTRTCGRCTSRSPPRGGRSRARAWLLLCEGAGPKNLSDLERHLELALNECADEPLLRAEALAQKSTNTSAEAVVQIDQAEAWAQEALEAARGAGADVERLVRYALSWTRGMTGRPIDDLLDTADPERGGTLHVATSPERVAGQQLVWRGELTRARAMLTHLRAVADEQGDPTSYALQRLHLCELELRAGGWDAAERLLDEWGDPSERELLVPPMYERCRSLLAAGRGASEEAEHWATHAIGLAQLTESRWDELEALRARGTAALLGHSPNIAVENLRAVWDHTVLEHVNEPGVFPVAPELVEALAELGSPMRPRPAPSSGCGSTPRDAFSASGALSAGSRNGALQGDRSIGPSARSRRSAPPAGPRKPGQSARASVRGGEGRAAS